MPSSTAAKAQPWKSHWPPSGNVLPQTTQDQTKYWNKKGDDLVFDGGSGCVLPITKPVEHAKKP